MIITCPECNTRYTVPENAFGDTGRDFRCTNCDYNWYEPSPFQKPKELVEEKPKIVEDIFQKIAQDQKITKDIKREKEFVAVIEDLPKEEPKKKPQNRKFKIKIPNITKIYSVKKIRGTCIIM
ncbi:MAG: zinc-ribbon domain-containing protein, partial [Pseudomonadota bacterium]